MRAILRYEHNYEPVEEERDVSSPPPDTIDVARGKYGEPMILKRVGVQYGVAYYQ